MKKSRSIVTSVKFSQEMISKIDEYVEKYGYADNSSLIRDAVNVIMDFLDVKENYLKTPENSHAFLKEIEPKLMSQKTHDAMVLVYQNLSKEEQEAFFYKIDKLRQTSIIDKREFLKLKHSAILWGYEMEPKVGYVGESYMGNFKRPLFRPVIPEEIKEWELMTHDQKITLLEDQRNKLIECKSIKHAPHNIQIIERNIDKISKGIEEDAKFEDESM